MINVLILSPFFYPEPISTGKYNTCLAKAFTDAGCSVEVWCSHPLYPSWEVEYSESTLQGVEIRRGGRFLRYPTRPVFRRIVLELWYAAFVLINLILVKKKYDIVIPILPPSLFVLALIAIRSKCRYIVGIVHDLQSVYAREGKGLLRKAIFPIISVIEKRVFRACDHLIYLSEAMRNEANSQYRIDRSKTSVQYPFVTIREFEDKGGLDSVISKGDVNIVYSGALGQKQAPDKLVELLLAILFKMPSAKAYIFSQGPIFDALKTTVKHERFIFSSLVGQNNLPELLLRSSVQIVPQESGTSNGSLPSKLPNLLASGVKIFCITDPGSELTSILSGYPNSHVSNTWDVSSNVSSLCELVGKSPVSQQQSKLLDQFSEMELIKSIRRVADK